jgi:hypothetical protein
MITFNAILHSEGIDPRGVRLIRHQDERAKRARAQSLYEIWRSNPRLLERYPFDSY